MGADNFTRMFTDSRLGRSCRSWPDVAFAILSVPTTFALGLALAVIFNDPRQGPHVLWAMFILPYAFGLPGCAGAELLNRDIINNMLRRCRHQLLGDGDLAKISILLVNLWLGFPTCS